MVYSSKTSNLIAFSYVGIWKWHAKTLFASWHVLIYFSRLITCILGLIACICNLNIDLSILILPFLLSLLLEMIALSFLNIMQKVEASTY